MSNARTANVSRSVFFCSAVLLAFSACNSSNGGAPLEAAEGADEPKAPAFVAQPTVAFPGQSRSGGASQVGLGTCVLKAPREVTAADARELGYDVDGDYALLESEWISDVQVSAAQVGTTRAHGMGRVDHVWLTERSPAPGVSSEESVPAGCPPVVGYELTVQTFTEDGALSGAYLARSSATPLGSQPRLGMVTEADLRNFAGTLPVASASTPPLFADAEVSWSGPENGKFKFTFSPRVEYPASDASCIEPLCPSARTRAPLSPGIASRQVGSVLDAADSDASSSLSEYVAELGPYRPNVRLWVVGFSSGSSSVDISVRIDGAEVRAGSLALENDPRILVPEAVGGWVDLGALDEGVPVEVDAVNVAGLADVQTRIIIGGCEVPAAAGRCAEPDCMARSTVAVSAGGCAGYVN